MYSIQALLLVVFVCATQAAISPLHRIRKSPQQVSADSVVATQTGLITVPAGSHVEPPNSPTQGIVVNPSVVHTPSGLQPVPAGAKVVPPGGVTGAGQQLLPVPAGAKVVPPGGVTGAGQQLLTGGIAAGINGQLGAIGGLNGQVSVPGVVPGLNGQPPING